MRLLNVQTKKLERVVDETVKKYAILSHRWVEDQEITFEDIDSLHTAKVQAKTGFAKLEGCCKEALLRNVKYVWIDTCCIDKNSSAELSEAINSMFRWYKKAVVCFAYLSDVGDDEVRRMDQFSKSVWFTRGWTLQELVAPKALHFFNQNWIEFGTKKSLVADVAKASNMPEQALIEPSSICEYSISQRMRWAANRKTERKEDRAYSMMGLFNVNMPMLYGEGGDRAFLRLQEEIIKNSDDHSIFAWTSLDSQDSGLFARSPEKFSHERRLAIPFTDKSEGTSYSITNQGLSITLRMTPWFSKTYLALLDFTVAYQGDDYHVGIFLQHVKGRSYRRVCLPGNKDLFFESVTSNTLRGREIQDCSIYVRQDETSSHITHALPHNQLPMYGVRIIDFERLNADPIVLSSGTFDPTSAIATLRPGQYGEVITLKVRETTVTNETKLSVLKIGFNFNFQLRVVMYTGNDYTLSSQLTKSVRDRTVMSITFTESEGWKDGETGEDVRLGEDPENMFMYQVPKEAEHVSLKLLGVFRIFGYVKLERTVYNGQMIWCITYTPASSALNPGTAQQSRSVSNTNTSTTYQGASVSTDNQTLATTNTTTTTSKSNSNTNINQNDEITPAPTGFTHSPPVEKPSNTPPSTTQTATQATQPQTNGSTQVNDKPSKPRSSASHSARWNLSQWKQNIGKGKKV